MRSAYKILVGKLERRELERPRSRWEHNIKMYLKEVKVCVDWMHLVHCKIQWWALVEKDSEPWVLQKVWGFVTI
jgi:hypothetical protein